MADGSVYMGGARVATSTVANGTQTDHVLKVTTVAADGVATGSASSATKTSVDSATASTSILAANTARRGATITNTDANDLYLDLSGGTASTTSYSVKIATEGYYELPYGYTGAVTGAWGADGAGAALVTEFE